MPDHGPMIFGDHVFEDGARHAGMIGGTATVPAGTCVTLRGMIGGDLVVEANARVSRSGMVGGRIVNRGDTILRDGG